MDSFWNFILGDGRLDGHSWLIGLCMGFVFKPMIDDLIKHFSKKKIKKG